MCILALVDAVSTKKNRNRGEKSGLVDSVSTKGILTFLVYYGIVGIFE